MVFVPKKLAVAVMVALGAASFAQAQTATTEKTVVTGSNIKRVDSEGPAPVQVITAEEIRTSGARDLGELLRGVSAASAGSQIDQTSNSFSNGAQTVSLRGLGSASTLLLVNGRRLTPSAYADPNTGNSTVYNLNAIPLDAIERIEVLKDGASAIYGSDAMAGVVNIILRSNYQGGEVSTSYSTNHEDLFTNYRASATLGFGNLAKDRFNVLASVEHYHRDPVNIKELSNVPVDDLVRHGAWRTTQTSNGYPANYFRENVLGNGNFATFVGIDAHCPASQIISNRCRYDTYNDVNISFKQDRDAFFSRGTFDVSPALSLFGEFGFSRIKTDYFSTPSSFSSALSVWGTSTGQLRTYRIILPVGHPDNPTTVPVAAAYTFADIGRRTSEQTNDTTRALAGVKGVVAGWDYESAVLWNSNERTDDNGGYLYFPALQAAIADLSYRPGGNNSAATLAKVGTSFEETGKATVTMWDLKGTRDLFAMAGGQLAVAAGVEVRKEELKVTSDPRIIAGDIVGRGTTAVDGSRNVQALYAELSVPFIKNVETQWALRTEHYSDFGNSTTPKVGAKWTVNPQFAVRGTWAQGFRAPALSQISEASVQAFNNNVQDPLRCPVFVTAGNPDCSTSFASYIKANPNLKPEKSDNFTLGLIASPTRDLNVSVDYYNIRRKDQIDRFTASYILANEAAFPGAIIRDPNPATWLPGVPNSGPIQAAIRQFFNLAETRTSGIDLDASLATSLGAMGRLNTTVQATYLISYEYAVAKTDPLIDQVGTFGGPSDALPRFRGNLATTWAYGPFSTLARVNYVNGWFNGGGGTAAQGGGCFFSGSLLTSTDCRVKPWTTFDLGLTYTGIKNLSMGLLVRNVFNTDAPYDANSAQTTQSGFNPVYHNPFGRYFTVNASYRFM